MKKIAIELIPDKELGGFTARIPGVPAYGEGETEMLAIADLKEAIQAYVEAFGIDELQTLVDIRMASHYVPVSLKEFSLA
ncbi:MAG: hypothetical protein Q7S19_00655 [bacterium]|nr:hypothetical protein [bacterium]